MDLPVMPPVAPMPAAAGPSTRAAAVPGRQVIGKTGTTQDFRDAWFMGFTGNFVCGVWFGNDDYTSTNRMTGGALPAQTWHEIMTYAHQGIELKQIPGLPAPTGPNYEAVSLSEIEKRHILATLEHTHWNKSQAAAILNIERSTLDRKIRVYELSR